MKFAKNPSNPHLFTFNLPLNAQGKDVNFLH